MAKQKQPLTELADQLVSKLGPSPIDPIEAAKGGTVDAGAEPAQEAPSAPAAPESTPEPVIAEPVVSKAAPVFEVTNGPITVSWGLQMIRLNAGDLVSEDSYGDGAVARFRSLGVALKEKV